MKFYKIEENLYQGGKYILEEPNEEFVCDAVVTLCPDVNISKDLKIKKHIVMEIEDGPFPGQSWLKKAVEEVENLIESGHKVYIHCHAGMSRSVMLTAAYMMKKDWLIWDEALEKIAKCNPTIDPSSRFITGLKEWQKLLKN